MKCLMKTSEPEYDFNKVYFDPDLKKKKSQWNCMKTNLREHMSYI